MVASMKMAVFWDITLYRLVKVKVHTASVIVLIIETVCTSEMSVYVNDLHTFHTV
jgi:hypothetical protein